LATLGVQVTEEELDRVLREAEQGSWSHVELLERLLGGPAQRRRESRVERRIREAHFVMGKTLESFDWEFNAAVIDRAKMEALATGDFIGRKDNLVMVGLSGVGKSHLLEGIGHRACVRGYRVRYTFSDKMLEELGASLVDGTTSKTIRFYSALDLLIIDGFGFDRLERERTPQALSLLYKVIEQRNTRRSTALATNIDFEAWGDYLGDGPMVMALLDRLMYRAVKLRFNGKSYRAHGPGSAPSEAGGPRESKAKGRKKR
jgi:DNA replication protein DnaC